MRSRDERLYLKDMQARCHRLIRQMAAVSTLEEFVRNETVYDAVLRNLEIIGEAAGKVSNETIDQIPDIPWKQITGLRHVLAHGYFSIDNKIIWTVATQRVPELERQLTAFLSASDNPQDES